MSERTIGEQRSATPRYMPVRSRILQRACACGTHTVAGGECEACKKKREAAGLQRAAISPAPVGEVPPIVHEVLGSPGQRLAATTPALTHPPLPPTFSA